MYEREIKNQSIKLSPWSDFSILIFEIYLYLIIPPAFLGLLLGGGRHLGSVMASTIRLNAELTQVSSFDPGFVPYFLRQYLESIDAGYETLTEDL